MKKNSENFSMDDIMKLANSEAGQQLIAFLKTQNSAQLQKAAEEAAAGHYAQAKQTMSDALSSQEAQALLSQLGGRSHG